MKILAIDTSESSCSVAVSCEDGQIVSQYQLAPQKHSELILPMMQEVMREAELALNDLDALAFSSGPGSFTGLRIGCGVIQGTAFAANLPVYSISSLEALAQGIRREQGGDNIYVSLDARMKEAYVAAYRWNNDKIETVIAPTLVAGDTFPPVNEPGWIGGGSGWAAYPDQISLQNLSDCYDAFQVHAEDVLELALVATDPPLAVDLIEPVYLRNNVAKTKVQQ